MHVYQNIPYLHLPISVVISLLLFPQLAYPYLSQRQHRMTKNHSLQSSDEFAPSYRYVKDYNYKKVDLYVWSPFRATTKPKLCRRSG